MYKLSLTNNNKFNKILSISENIQKTKLILLHLHELPANFHFNLSKSRISVQFECLYIIRNIQNIKHFISILY